MDRSLDGCNPFASIVFRCTWCTRHFIVEYASRDPDPNTPLELELIGPKTFLEKGYNAIVENISPGFVRIAAQAAESEHHNLLEVAGPGYRKALEFLIKDYVIYKGLASRDTVERVQLGTVIENYVADVRIKTCASCAGWLGNDQTHYFQRHTDADLSDLKTLIELTTRWIESEELTVQYQQRLRTTNQYARASARATRIRSAVPYIKHADRNCNRIMTRCFLSFSCFKSSLPKR